MASALPSYQARVRIAPRNTKQFPSWWLSLHPRGSARFWRAVEMERVSARVDRSDRDGIAYIVNQLKENRHERHR